MRYPWFFSNLRSVGRVVDHEVVAMSRGSQNATQLAEMEKRNREELMDNTLRLGRLMGAINRAQSQIG